MPPPVDDDRITRFGSELAECLRSHDSQWAGAGRQGYSPRVRAETASPILERPGTDLLAALVDRELRWILA